jgi:hypothetical protein
LLFNIEKYKSPLSLMNNVPHALIKADAQTVWEEICNKYNLEKDIKRLMLKVDGKLGKEDLRMISNTVNAFV